MSAVATRGDFNLAAAREAKRAGVMLTPYAEDRIREDDERIERERKEAARAERREADGPQALEDAHNAATDYARHQDETIRLATETIAALKSLALARRAHEQAQGKLRTLGFTGAEMPKARIKLVLQDGYRGLLRELSFLVNGCQG